MALAELLRGAAISLLAVITLTAVWQIRRRKLQYWIGGYVLGEARRLWRPRRASQAAPMHVLLCIADHFEPSWGGASEEVASARVAAWVRDYPRLLGVFRDSDGRPPRHTFFYPIDQYESHHVDALAGLCHEGFGEVEIHLHHDHDTADGLARTLSRFTELFADRHGLLGRWPGGRAGYGFVHGNWALDNSRPDGRWCGVNNELDVLRRTGCYADFTLPSAPDATQTRKINSIYYAAGCPHRRKSHDLGIDVGHGAPPPNSLMLVQGPLRIVWPKGSWTPKIENGCIQRGQPPTTERLNQWIRTGVHIRSRPDWVFVKLHTHGATEANQKVLLGDPMIRFHQALAHRMAADKNFYVHYVTAREMYNLAKAAEAGWSGSVADARDFVVKPPSPDNTISGQHLSDSRASASLSIISDR